jgi:hypothetical protein
MDGSTLPRAFIVSSRSGRTIPGVLVGFDIEGGAGYRLLHFVWRHRVALALAAITVGAAVLRFAAEQRADRRAVEARHDEVG